MYHPKSRDDIQIQFVDLQSQQRPQSHSQGRNQLQKYQQLIGMLTKKQTEKGDIQYYINKKKRQKLKGIYLNKIKIVDRKRQSQSMIIPAMVVQEKESILWFDNDKQQKKYNYSQDRKWKEKGNSFSLEKQLIFNLKNHKTQKKLGFGKNQQDKIINNIKTQSKRQQVLFNVYAIKKKKSRGLEKSPNNNYSSQFTQNKKKDFESPDSKKDQSSHKKSWLRSRQHQNIKQFNIETILRRKYGHDFQFFMTQYLKRMGLQKDTKVFIFNSGDLWVKKILLEKGWSENLSKESMAYHFKWTNSVHSLPKFKQQTINHFQNSDMLTSKYGLLRQTNNDPQLKAYLPRSYDLSSESAQFLDNYYRTGISCLLKKIVNYIKSKLQQIQWSMINSNQFQTYYKDIVQGRKFFQEKPLLFLHIPYTIQIISYFLCWKNNIENHKINPFMILSKISIAKIANFGKVNLPYDQFYYDNQALQGLSPINKKNNLIFGQNANYYSTKNPFNYPSKQLLSLVISIHDYFMVKIKSFKTDGIHNLWITKSGTSSKGVGIKLNSQIQLITKNKQNKIVQKYIQNCLIINDNSYISKKKFDLRIWVLVKSFQPVISYYHRQFYGRICPEQYSITQYQQSKKHLTNYTQNKGCYIDQKQSVIKGSQLLLKISKIYSIDYTSLFYLELEKMIKLVLKKYQGKIESHEQCFQLYGFDILIDQTLSINLLQVNLSPACKERVQWLTNLLESMTRSMLNIVLRQDRQNIQKGQWISLN